MPFCSLIFSSSVSLLSLITFNVFFISDIVALLSTNLIFSTNFVSQHAWYCLSHFKPFEYSYNSHCNVFVCLFLTFVSVQDWFQWSDFFFFSLQQVLFSCFLACLVNFYLMLDIVNFFFLGALFFFIPLNILELCFWMQLNYMKTVWYFWILFLRFAR